ncbi:hypothetical protein TSAR_012319 [Trichomalopsis sarcophagae]|uniref:Hexosyltransferase n=1 Tax=Trichomalopsis sarcophagae TaxID=543379 RepID=A0A232EQ35_9HYME|nr:hypothetical protein TSAR_012319 [Trichomalopsis sarcophagae]
MDRVRLLPIQLPPASSISGNNGNAKGKISFVRRLALGFIILAGLGLLYVPAYHSAQGQFSGLGETPSPVGSVGGTHFVASLGYPSFMLIVIMILAQLHGWGYNTSRDVCSYIHPENTTAILNPKTICNEVPYLLIVVCSAVPNLGARIAIRNTWGNKSNLDTQYESPVKVAFLLGQSDNDTLNSYVIDESHLYNDIIQESFHDTYNNLTLKSVMLLKWATTNCDKLTYLMKTDDDMFVNVPALVKALKGRPKSTGTLIGSLICNARPITDPKNKWYTPKYMYSERTYPNYLSGTGYVMSFDVAQRLYKAALSTPVLHLEDVYITGVCAKRAGLRPTNQYGFSYIPRKLETCALRDVITAHKVNATTMQTIWSKLNEPMEAACASANHSATDKKSATVSRLGRHIGYFLLKSRILSSRCA